MSVTEICSECKATKECKTYDEFIDAVLNHYKAHHPTQYAELIRQRAGQLKLFSEPAKSKK